MKLQSKTYLLAFLLFTPHLLVADQQFEELLKAGVFLDNLPPWELYEAPPTIITQDPPVVLEADSKGNVYTPTITKSKFGTYEVSKRLVSEAELKEVSSGRTVIFKDMEHSDLATQSLYDSPTALSSTSCPLDQSYSIVGTTTNVEATGGVTVSNTNRPVGATTQWLVFEFYTVNYRARGSHAPLVLFHDDVLHGWGAFIGDNAGSPQGCGSSARFNSQIEGWIQTVQPPGSPPYSPTANWQSYTFNGSNSCGNEMYNGTVPIYGGYNVPKYRFEMQASTGHWVSYRIQEWVYGMTGWQTFTDWKTLDVDTGSWAFTPLNWLTGTEGILIGATKAVVGSGSWSINLVNVDCGWF